VESRDGFFIQRDGGKDHELKTAEGVRKQHLDEWWVSVQSRFDAQSVRARAGATSPHGFEAIVGGESAQSCLPDDTWENGILDDVPDPRQAHSAVWTGSLMVVWGGAPSAFGQELDTPTAAPRAIPASLPVLDSLTKKPVGYYSYFTVRLARSFSRTS
jgi:hypothetical protein